MVNKDELDKLRQEMEALESWRDVPRHVVAELMEVCAVCGRVRDREHLVHCDCCADVYVCEEGLCTWLHHASIHPSTPFTV
jgi:hypothetical protein